MFKKLEKYSQIQGIYRGYNEVIKASTDKALNNLAEETRAYLVNNCWIISIDRGTSWPLEILQEQERQWLIVISENLNETEAVAAIEKELAHVYLQHLWSMM